MAKDQTITPASEAGQAANGMGPMEHPAWDRLEQAEAALRVWAAYARAGEDEDAINADELASLQVSMAAIGPCIEAAREAMESLLCGWPGVPQLLGLLFGQHLAVSLDGTLWAALEKSAAAPKREDLALTAELAAHWLSTWREYVAHQELPGIERAKHEH